MGVKVERMLDLLLLDVLREYRARIDVVLEQLEAAYGQITYDRIMDGELPLPGELGDLRVFFHGLGCSVGFEGDTLMWDWHPSDVLISDAWKLCQFTQGHPERFGRWVDVENVRAEVADLVAQGRLQLAPKSETWFVLPSPSEAEQTHTLPSGGCSLREAARSPFRGQN